MRECCALILIAAAVLLATRWVALPRATADERPRPQRRAILPVTAVLPADPPNVISPTLGGTQLWGDELYYGQWRIQRNVVTGHCRLLDPDDLRRDWGTFDDCQRRLDELKRQGDLQPASGRVVIVLHGLLSTRQAMAPLASYLETRGRYTVINVTYPSSRAAVADHAQALAHIVAHLPDASEINFVGHSLGNLVIRHYLADQAAARSGARPDPRIRRFVMLGPPNQGSRMAEVLNGNILFDVALGATGEQLGRQWRDLERRLATPACEFGVIAGGRGNDVGFNPLLAGDDDGTVRVAETRLDGARDFVVVDTLHSAMMRSAEVQRHTLHFLRHGTFR